MMCCMPESMAMIHKIIVKIMFMMKGNTLPLGP